MANLSENIAQTVTSVGARASYGDPVTVGGIEIVPVALVWFGFGAGSDESNDDSIQGGAGGGGVSIPVGAYVPAPDGVRFRANPVALLAVALPLVVASAWALVGAGLLKRGLARRR